MIEKILKKYWGYDCFRPLQKEIIESILAGKDTLGILPTGGGKSITFQVPGLIAEGLVIIVTPLISLMKDQVDNLKHRRIQGVYLHSGMTLKERNLAKERLFNNKAKFLYISPERLSSESFINEIRSLKVAFIVIDEAHCISQWGYDFRPSYLKIKKLRSLFPSSPVLALTASATKEVGEDIVRQLNFGKNYEVFRGSIARSNLSYVVRSSDGKLSDIQKIISAVPGSAIVYVRSRKKTREISEYLNNMGINSTYYHAGLDNEIKEERQNKWKTGAFQVIVATNAFGMGIDKGDVRLVIHYDMPPSLEEYYQEAGRAGRDGHQSYAVLLTSPRDKATLRRQLTLQFPQKEIIRKIYTRLCVFSHLGIGEGYDKTLEFDLEKFCKTYNLEEKIVRPSLRLLSQAGYAEFIEEFENSSRLMVIIDRDELYKYRFHSNIHEKILTAVLREYPGLFTDYVFINEKKIAYLTQIDPRVIYEKLVEMSKEKVINYIPRRKTPLIYFPTSMEEEKYVVIGKNIYEERKDILEKRINAMINYAFGKYDCRQTKLMEYFGEYTSDECGHCDSCRESKKRKKKNPASADLMEAIAKCLNSSQRGLHDDDLRDAFGKQFEKAVEILRNLVRDGIVDRKNGFWFKSPAVKHPYNKKC